MSVDFATQRLRMVDGQVRTTDVTSLEIIDAMLAVPREDFVPARKRALSYIDEDLEIAPAIGGNPARFLMEASPFAKMVQMADIRANDFVLDVGTGTGLWAVDMGDRYPSCEIIGTDLSPTQVPYAPPNVRFEIDDCCSEWTYPENSFDLIHVRGLTGSVGNWPKFYQECFKYGLRFFFLFLEIFPFG